MNEKDDDIQEWGSLLAELHYLSTNEPVATINKNNTSTAKDFSNCLILIKMTFVHKLWGKVGKRTRSNYSFPRPCISILGATRLQAADIRPWLTSL